MLAVNGDDSRAKWCDNKFDHFILIQSARQHHQPVIYLRIVLLSTTQRPPLFQLGNFMGVLLNMTGVWQSLFTCRCFSANSHHHRTQTTWCLSTYSCTYPKIWGWLIDTFFSYPPLRIGNLEYFTRVTRCNLQTRREDSTGRSPMDRTGYHSVGLSTSSLAQLAP